MSVATPEELKAAKATKESDRKKKQLSLAAQREIFNNQFMALKPKQRAFITLRMQNPTWSDSRCARDAGYALTSSAKPSAIVKAIHGKLGKVFHDCFGYDEFDLCKTMVEAARKAEIITYSVIRTYKEGLVQTEEIVKSKQPDHRVRLVAAKMIARYGEYEPGIRLKHEHTGQVGIAHFAQKMSLVEMDRQERQLESEISAEYEVQDAVN